MNYYWQLSVFYLFYFGSLGALVPYWGLYLHTLGFDANAIGELMAIILVTKIIAPNIWGWIADYTGKHIFLVRFSSILAVIFFAGILIDQSYTWLIITLFLFSFFWNAALPQFEAVTFNLLGKRPYQYGIIRMWGSVGFIITVILFGWLFQYISITLLPILLIGLFTCIWLTSLLIPEQATANLSISTESFYQIITRPTVIALFISCFLMQFSHGPYYTFYSIYLEDNGYSRDIIGLLWALGVIAEIGIFLVIKQLFAKFVINNLFILSIAITALRWLLIGYYIESVSIIIFAQLLNAASFGLYHAVAMQIIRQNFTDQHQGKAQALYGSVSFGAGGAIGSLISGYTWEIYGATANYSCASIICITAVLISWKWMEEKNN
ncbi:MAG TPA: MFS transporter [Thioploca sp.]|nr:MFS transporter [Thioploca sp.]